MSSAIIEVADLVKNFGQFAAVKGVNFEVNEGEIFGLLGPNGAGKTTTISMLSCLAEPTSGAAKIAGFNVVKDAVEVKKIIGVVPQDIALYPTLSAVENLRFFGHIQGLSGRELKERVSNALEIVGLSDRAKEAVQNYSGGMKRRLNMAAGLLHRPKVLFLDEPTVGVDPQSRNHVFENVKSLNREGMTIIYTTHYMEEADLLCDRVAIMDEGELVALDAPKELVKKLGRGLIRIGVINLDKHIMSRINGSPRVKKTSLIDGVLSIEAADVQLALLDVIGIFNEAQVNMKSLEILESNLESVFLYLTGKKLRD